jgi:N-acetylglucosamine-6-phosphate deacetylase
MTFRFAAMLPNGRGGLYRGRVAVAGDRILDVSFDDPGAAGEPVDVDFDFTPHVALPGFIDLQVNGAFGHDITTDPASLWTVGEGLTRYGVTAFAPTIITSPGRRRQAAYDAIGRRPAGYAGAEPLGLHIEGPALAGNYAGTHPASSITAVEDSLAAELAGAAGSIALVTVAPELDGAPALIEHLTAAGIVVSLGHSGATAAQAGEAVDAGADAFTHLFNAMVPLHHREVGIVGVALLRQGTWLSLIPDGHHVSDDAIELVRRVAGAGRIFLVTDSMAGAGAPPGVYRIGGTTVTCDDAPRHDRGGLAGSLITFAEGARRYRHRTGATWDEMAQVTSANAAALLGDRSRGELAPGRRADVVIVDGDLEPVATITGGSVSHPLPQQSGRPGRPARARRPVGRTTVGVDIGGTFFKAALFDGARVGVVHRRTTGRDRPAAEVLAEVRRVVDELLASATGEVAGVGIACPGVVDAAAGKVMEATNLDWRAVDVIAGVGDDLGVPVAIEHDVYLGAVAEWEAGGGVGRESMLYVSVGTGVASRLFTPAGTYRGHLGLAGELGLTATGDDARPLESVASARAISDAYFLLTGRRASAESVVAAVESDPTAAGVWATAIEALARGIAAAILLEDPEVVVIGGGVSNAGSELLGPLRPRVAELVVALREPPPIVRASHGAHSGVVGAAIHAARTAAERR